MFPLIFEKLKRDEEKAHTHAKIQTLANTEQDLVQVGTVMDLLFMHEISNLMIICSKVFQCFDVLPYHVLTAYEDLITHLTEAKSSIANSEAPTVKKSTIHLVVNQRFGSFLTTQWK